MATARSVAAQIDGTVPIEIGLMDQHLDRHVGPARVLAALMSGISLLAWGVAILGTYGLFSQLVASRTREIGVRIALGAGRSAILKSVLGRAVVLGVIGVGVGLVLWRLTGKLLGSLIYGVDVTDPLVLTGVSVSVLAVTSLASYLPARRATRIDPVSVLSRTARR
ncbi:MAG: FtsX-like permease family protein [Acidobacteria bacterium]|nr:FtsX-like permease family protein [Acidobacteriota bacterium]